jgi:hypothetical protein
MEIHEHPAISINNHTYDGDFTGDDVARALCASFKDRPSECSQQSYYMLKGKKEDYFNLPVEDVSDHWKRDLIIAIFFLIFINFGMYKVYNKKVVKENKTEIQMEVNQAVAQYFALRGEEPEQ